MELCGGLYHCPCIFCTYQGHAGFGCCYVTENQRTLKTLIDELEGVKESDTVTEEDKAKVSRLITKLSNYTKKTNVLEMILGK